MNALQVVNSCLTWSGLTKSGRGEIPLLFHGVVGQVQEKLPLFVLELEHLLTGYERSSQSKFLQPRRGGGGAQLHQAAGERGCQAEGYWGDYALQVVGGASPLYV